MLFARLLSSVLLCCLSSWACAQQAGCSSSFSDSEVARLIVNNYVASGATAPAITLQTSPAGFTFRAVCLSNAGVRDLYRFVSLVAYFTYNGSAPAYGQFEFECINAAWSATSSILGPAVTARTMLTPDAPAITAKLRTDCAYCLNPTLLQTDAVTHCYACVGCYQQLCYVSNGRNPLTLVLTCCNAFLSNGTCATQCPSAFAINNSGVCAYNVFYSQYGILLAIGIALAVGIVLGLCCCCIFACVCCRMKYEHKRKLRAHTRSPTFSDDKTTFSALM